MDTLEFYGGVNEIGGNKIKLNLDSTSLFLVFVMSFSQNGKFFREYMNPRTGNKLGDCLKMGLLPDIKGIYREDYLRHKDKRFKEKCAVDGLLLSHAHADHADDIYFLREDIPIYMSFYSKIILDVIDRVGRASKEILTYKPMFQYNSKVESEKIKYTEKKYYRRKQIVTCDKTKEVNNPMPLREVNVLEPYDEVDIGNLKVQLAPVDHSLPGAAAYLIEGNKNVVYTGDLRFHGRKKRDSEKFVKKATDFEPDIMICEGTRINEYTNYWAPKSEEDIQNKSCELINSFNGLAIVNFPERDLDRLTTFYNIAKETGRTLLINLKQAYMLKKFEKCALDSKFPTLKDDHIAVYVHRKGKGAYPYDTFVHVNDKWTYSNKKIAKKDYEDWEIEIIEHENTVNYKDIKENERHYIFRLDDYSLTELIDIEPKYAIYIRSITDPFDEGMELDYEITKNWFDYFNIPIYESFHVSGHANGPQLLEMIREINPKTLYPIHTEHIEMFDVLREDGINVIHPKLKK